TTRPTHLTLLHPHPDPRAPPSFPTRRSSDLVATRSVQLPTASARSTSIAWLPMMRSASATRSSNRQQKQPPATSPAGTPRLRKRSEEHTSELQSLTNLVCRLLLEKKTKNICT